MKISACSHRPALVPCGLKNFEYQIDPYVGCAHFCRYCYVLSEAETDWTEEIMMHGNIAGQLSKELEKIPPQTIYMGYYTDPYQPCENEYRQTRTVLELLLEKGFSASILTKSDRVVRDLDVLQNMAHASVGVSVAFNDNRVRQQFEANTVDTEARFEALSTLRTAGIRTTAMLCPVIPYITDVKPLIDRLAPLTEVIWIYGLNIEKRTVINWKHVEIILRIHFFELKEQIEEIVLNKAHPYWTRLRQELSDMQKGGQLNLEIHV